MEIDCNLGDDSCAGLVIWVRNRWRAFYGDK